MTRRENRRAILSLGLSLSLSLGFLEMVIATVLFAPSRFPPFPGVLASLAATIASLLLGYGALWFLIAAPMRRLLRLEAIPLAGSLAAFLGTSFTLIALRLARPSLAALDVFKIFLLLMICLATAIGFYFIAKPAARRMRPGVAPLLGLAIPAVLAEAMVLAWYCRHHVESFFAAPSLAAGAGGLLVAGLTAGLFYVAGGRIRILRWLTLSTALVVASPLLATVAEAVLAPAPEKRQETQRGIPRVILITDDTLRSDFLSCYNPQGISTPHTDRLATDGILFTKAYSTAPWTLPSLASILTGLSPPVHGVTNLSSRLPDAAKTLAEHLRDAGYHTAAFVQSSLLAPEWNLYQGFLETHLPRARTYPTWGGHFLQKLLPGRFRRDSSARSLTRSVVDWLAENHGRDFFLWVHYVDPHMPYTPPADLLPEDGPPPLDARFLDAGMIRGGYAVPTLEEREEMRALYGAEVRLVDEGVGRLLAALDRLGLYEESLIVLTSDHGEELWEHGGFEHGHTLYEEVLRVPLLVKPPRSSAGRRIDTPVSTASVLPTVLDLCGVEHAADRLSAASLSSSWGADGGAFEERPIISSAVLFYEGRESVVLDGWKYIRSLVGGREELYDLTKDPGEQTSVVSLFPEKARRARKLLDDHGRRARELARAQGLRDEEAEPDEDTRRELKNLGYVR